MYKLYTYIYIYSVNLLNTKATEIQCEWILWQHHLEVNMDRKGCKIDSINISYPIHAHFYIYIYTETKVA